MRTKSVRVLLLVLVGALLAVLIVATRERQTSESLVGVGHGPPKSGSSSMPSEKEKVSGPPAPGDPTAASETDKVSIPLARLLRLMSDRAPGAELRRALSRAKLAVHDAEPDRAAAAIIALLESGEDAVSGLGFVVGPEGVMEETPSWRTALLDLLGQTDPALSADYSRRVVASTLSPDEYALALRNIAWTDTDGRLNAELRTHFAAMVSRPEWRQQPTRGFLEAFDIAVASGAIREVAGLVRASAGAEPAESRAAFVALDRIMLRDPQAMVDMFATDSSLLAQAPMHRASLLSRLDVRDPTHAQLLANYLLRPDHSAGELGYFCEVFPNGNRFTSNRLVTRAEPGGGVGQMQEIDAATRRVVSAWLADPRFASRRAELSGILRRLEAFAAGGSH